MIPSGADNPHLRSRGLGARLSAHLDRDLRIWGPVSAAAASGGNFLLAVLVARRSSPAEFGAYATLFAAYSLVLMWNRGRLIQPYLIVFSGIGASEGRARWLLHESIRYSTAISPIVLAIGIVATDAPLALVCAMWLSSTVLVPLDAIRYVHATHGRPGRTAEVDVLWVAFQAALSVALYLVEAPPWSLVAAWGVSGGLAAAICGRRLARDVGRDTAEHEVVPSVSYAVELASPALLEVALFWAVGVTVSAGVSGEYKAALLCFGPLLVASTGLLLVSMPRALAQTWESGRLSSEAASYMRRMVALTAIYGTMVIAVPRHWIESILGSAAPSSTEVLVAVTCLFGAQAILTSVMLGLRARDARSATLSIRGVWAAGTVLLVVALGPIRPPATVGWAHASATVIAAAAAYWWLRHTAVATTAEGSDVLP